MIGGVDRRHRVVPPATDRLATGHEVTGREAMISRAGPSHGARAPLRTSGVDRRKRDGRITAGDREVVPTTPRRPVITADRRLGVRPTGMDERRTGAHQTVGEGRRTHAHRTV